MLYPWNMKHIRNKLRCDTNVRTLNASMKERYWRIKSMHVGVKLLDQHGRTYDQDVTQWLPTPTVNDIGKVSVGKVHQNDLVFQMNTSSRKILREVLSGILITEPVMRSRIRGRRYPKRRGFWDEMDLRFGVINMTNINRKERERKRQLEKSQSNSNITSILKREYICMGNAWTCDMQKKLHHGLSPIKSYQHTINLHTSKCMIICYNAYVVQCMRF